ncbi:putative ribonuclease H-like domain-containing protein, partial [Tanacetum coccineum]
SSSIPADYVSAGHVLVPADRNSPKGGWGKKMQTEIQLFIRPVSLDEPSCCTKRENKDIWMAIKYLGCGQLRIEEDEEARPDNELEIKPEVSKSPSFYRAYLYSDQQRIVPIKFLRNFWVVSDNEMEDLFCRSFVLIPEMRCSRDPDMIYEDLPVDHVNVKTVDEKARDTCLMKMALSAAEFAMMGISPKIDPAAIETDQQSILLFDATHSSWFSKRPATCFCWIEPVFCWTMGTAFKGEPQAGDPIQDNEHRWLQEGWAVMCNFKTINKLAKEGLVLSSSNGPRINGTQCRLCKEHAKHQRQEHEANDAAARIWLFDPAWALILPFTDPARHDSCFKDLQKIDSADVVTNWQSCLPDNSSVSADFHPVYADESTLPPGQQLGSTPAVEVNPVPTKQGNTIHTQSSDLGDLASPVKTRSRAQKSTINNQLVIAKALEDPDWFDDMQEECNISSISKGIVVRNKARLVAQGHRQEEGIDYDEVFAPVARIEAIRLFLAFASYMGFLVYQLDVKSAFLYGEIEEEVYVTQPKGFEDPYFPKHVYRVVKALYGLHQAPRAWYARLSTFLLQHNYRRGTIDKTLFIKKDSRDIILVQVYVDDIIFGSTNKAWCDEFEVLMKGEFEMSAMGEMTFFLGLQVKQLPDGLFISQDKYVKDMLTKFDMESVRTATTPYEAAKTKLKDETDPPVNVHLYRSMIGSLMYLTASRPDIMFAVSACSRHQVTPLTSHLNAVKKIFKYLKGQPKLGLWYPKDSPFQLEAYSDSDYAGSHGDRKSTTGGCQFLGRRLISWQCKKQTIVATSSTEAEYVAAASCCAQVLWIQNQLLDYGFNFMNTKIFIDNQSTICIVKNPVFHQRTKHIEIRHHFIRDANEKNLIQVLKIHTDDNVADLLTKAFDGPRFAYLVVHIGMMDMMLVSAGCTMVLLVVILPAERMVSAGWSMVLLVVIFPAGRLVSAGCTMVLLVVIVPAGFFVPAGSYGLCCWFRVHAGTHTSAGRFISADRVLVPAVYMVSVVG